LGRGPPAHHAQQGPQSASRSAVNQCTWGGPGRAVCARAPTFEPGRRRRRSVSGRRLKWHWRPGGVDWWRGMPMNRGGRGLPSCAATSGSRGKRGQDDVRARTRGGGGKTKKHAIWGSRAPSVTVTPPSQSPRDVSPHTTRPRPSARHTSRGRPRTPGCPKGSPNVSRAKPFAVDASGSLPEQNRE